jgi:hypothetical protein
MTDFGLAVAKTQQAARNQPQAIEDVSETFLTKKPKKSSQTFQDRRGSRRPAKRNP